MTGLSTRRDGRRLKSAKARNRGEGYGLGGAGRSAMGIPSTAAVLSTNAVSRPGVTVRMAAATVKLISAVAISTPNPPPF